MIKVQELRSYTKSDGVLIWELERKTCYRRYKKTGRNNRFFFIPSLCPS